jgi:NAD-dependent SIR2 family protein deacetylase
LDGLHRKSGIHPDNIVELHGNRNVERCKVCKKIYYRDFGVRTAPKMLEHDTVRNCELDDCNGLLADMWINFGERLDEDVIGKATTVHE